MRRRPDANHPGPSLGEVRGRLAELIGEIGKIPPQDIVDGASIDESLRLESVAFVELHVALEDEYDCEIDPIRVVELNEFGAIAEYIHQCATGGAA